MAATNRPLTPAQSRMLDRVKTEQVESRHDHWRINGARISGVQGNVLDYLRDARVIRLTRAEIRTVGLVEPRPAWIAHAV